MQKIKEFELIIDQLKSENKNLNNQNFELKRKNDENLDILLKVEQRTCKIGETIGIGKFSGDHPSLGRNFSPRLLYGISHL